MKRRRICGDGKVPPAGGLVVLDGIVTVESYPNMNPGNTGTSMLSPLTILTRGIILKKDSAATLIVIRKTGGRTMIFHLPNEPLSGPTLGTQNMIYKTRYIVPFRIPIFI
jgi:hypothetical protein